MWENDHDKIALLELYLTGRLPLRKRQADSWKTLAELPWTRKTRRRGELELVPEQRDKLQALLERVWHEWRLVAEGLAIRGLDVTPTGLSRLQDSLRAQAVPILPSRLNRRTATAAVAPHSKSTLTAVRRAALGETAVTGDGIVRLRPPRALRFARGTHESDATEISSVLGEVAVTQRALLDGTRIVGEVKAVLLVENLGPFQDLTPPDGWLVVHVPGWDTATVRLLLVQLSNVAIVLFGDLDPTGLRIARHLREIHPDLIWMVPSFWRDYIEARGLPGKWHEELDLSNEPALVQELARRGLWLEQECIVLDPRLRSALECAIRPVVP
jgi:Wadjet anti plasmid transformation system JetA-like protein